MCILVPPCVRHSYKVSKMLAATWFTHPKILPSLDGEEIIDLAVGETHGLAVSKGGDVFSWGDNTHAQLGAITKPNGEPLLTRYEAKAQLCDLPTGAYAATVCCGSSHSVCLASDGAVYVRTGGPDGRACHSWLLMLRAAAAACS
jgi:alpha-tubulin suppressor-like RCC1 family protein